MIILYLLLGLMLARVFRSAASLHRTQARCHVLFASFSRTRCYRR
jgi:hypothetical protein